MNAADLAGGSFASGGLASNNLPMTSISNSQAPKMIPVPGLPSQQTLQQQQQQQANLQQIQQRNNLQHQPNNGLAPRNQQQQQLGQLSNNQGLYHSQGQQSSGLSGQKQAGVLFHRRSCPLCLDCFCCIYGTWYFCACSQFSLGIEFLLLSF